MQATAAMAGFNTSFQREHDYGVDGTFHPVVRRGSRFIETGIPLDFQLKASIAWELRDEHIVYDMEAPAYNDIVERSEAETTKILILLCLPADQHLWHASDHHATTLCNCCYWFLPTGPATPNTTSIRVHIPIGNILTPEMLEWLMEEEHDRRYGQL